MIIRIEMTLIDLDVPSQEPVARSVVEAIAIDPLPADHMDELQLSIDSIMAQVQDKIDTAQKELRSQFDKRVLRFRTHGETGEQK